MASKINDRPSSTVLLLLAAIMPSGIPMAAAISGAVTAI